MTAQAEVAPSSSELEGGCRSGVGKAGLEPPKQPFPGFPSRRKGPCVPILREEPGSQALSPVSPASPPVSSTHKPLTRHMVASALGAPSSHPILVNSVLYTLILSNTLTMGHPVGSRYKMSRLSQLSFRSKCIFVTCPHLQVSRPFLLASLLPDPHHFWNNEVSGIHALGSCSQSLVSPGGGHLVTTMSKAKTLEYGLPHSDIPSSTTPQALMQLGQQF